MTHFADYSPQNLHTDFLTAACGEVIHVRESTLHPTCKRCQAAAKRQQITLAQDKRLNYKRP